jgi:hypothetical protein
MAIDDRDKYPLQQNSPRFANNDRLARQMVSTKNPDGAGRPYPLAGPVGPPRPGMTAGLGNQVRNTDGSRGMARQAEISASKAGGTARKSSSVPGDEN